jgi:hypothetical protein
VGVHDIMKVIGGGEGSGKGAHMTGGEQMRFEVCRTENSLQGLQAS